MDENEKMDKNEKKEEIVKTDDNPTVLEEKCKKTNKVIPVIIGLIIGLVIMYGIIALLTGSFSCGIQFIAGVNGKVITSNKLYNKMKDYYGLTFLLEQVDRNILENMYTLDDETKSEIEEQAKYYINMYESYYGYTEEQFLKENGFSSYDEFTNYLALDKRRELYYKDYLKTLITDEEIDKYYEEDVFGEIDSKHILVEISENRTEDEAKKIAEEIIVKLNKGATFDDIVQEYGDKVKKEDLGYQAFNSSLEESYMTALKNLENGKFSQAPVQTSYGYHIIYRIDQKDKPTLDEVKDDILEAIGTEKTREDENAYYQAMIKLREDEGLKIFDKSIKKQYEEYCAGITKTEE